MNVPWDSARVIDDARKRKVERYERLELDIKEKWLAVDYCPLELEARGVINARNSGVPTMLTKMFKFRNFKKFRSTLGKIALLGSHRVWLSRKSQTFVGGNFIQPTSPLHPRNQKCHKRHKHAHVKLVGLW